MSINQQLGFFKRYICFKKGNSRFLCRNCLKLQADHMKNVLKKLYDLVTKPAPKKKLIPIPVRANNGR